MQLKIKQLELIEIFLRMKKEKIIANQEDYIIFEVAVILNVKVMGIEIKHY